MIMIIIIIITIVLLLIRKEHLLDTNQKRCYASHIHNSYAIPAYRNRTTRVPSLSKQLVYLIPIPNQSMPENQTRSETELLLSVWPEICILPSIQLCSTKFVAL